MRFLVMFLIICITFTGCISTKTWNYTASEPSTLSQIVPKKVTIPPFTDARNNENTDVTLLYLVPPMPFGWANFNIPEGWEKYKWDPKLDFAKATVEELRAANIYKEVFFTERPAEGELILQGRINSSSLHLKLFSYCLGVYGPLLWFVGFPATMIENDLDLTFTLMDAETRKVYWQKNYKRNLSGINWLYYTNVNFEYSQMMKDILLSLAKDMRNEFQSNIAQK